jgi:type II secretory pathway component GspD/PulD (secretin)
VTIVLLALLALAPNVGRASARLPRVSLDVKDADIRVILKSMQTQCGMRNLVIDPLVQGKGTFLFRELSCPVAFDTVFKTMGLKSVTYGKNVVTVMPRNK